MSIFLTLDSTNKGVNENTDDFRIRFNRPMVLYPKDFNEGNNRLKNYHWQVSLTTLNTWYSWSNISATDYSNARLTYSHNSGGAWTNIDLPDGNYSLSALNSAIQAELVANGHSGTGISIIPNYSTGKVLLTLEATYQVDFSTSNFYLLLGFSGTQAASVITAASTYGDNVGNINNSVNNILLHCDIVDDEGSISSQNGSDILHTFVPSTPPYSNIEESPNERVYLPVRSAERIESIRCYLTDQLNRRINLRGEPMSVSIHLKKVKNL